MTLPVASAQYPLDRLRDWEAYRAKAHHWTATGAARGARVLLWPEYASLELVSLFDTDVQRSLPRQIDALQTLCAAFRDLYRELARQYGVVLLPGTFPFRLDGGEVRNRAWLFGPEGEIGFQDKLMMTRFENESWFIRGGDRLNALDTPFGRLGISICYDAEFPLIARRLVEQGADVILVPSCTDTLAGYHRVRIGCQARALENQCYVIQSPTIGRADWSAAVDVNVGQAGIFTPIDHGFPEDGILALGEPDTPQWLMADLQAARIATVRRDGQVLNHRDWARQVAVSHANGANTFLPGTPQ